MCQADELVNGYKCRLKIKKTFSLMSEQPRTEREPLCAILKFGTPKTIQSDSMDEHACVGLGFAIIV